MEFLVDIDLSKTKYMDDGSVIVGNISRTELCGFTIEPITINGDFLLELLINRKANLRSCK